LLAGGSDGLARAAAARARRGEHYEAALGADVPCAPALRAGLRFRSLASSTAPALVARCGPLHVHLVLRTGDGFLEGDGRLDPYVGAARRTAARTAAEAPAEAAPEEIGEQILEMAEDVG